MDACDDDSLSRFRPSGFSSKTQAKTSTGTKPIESGTTSAFNAEPSASNTGSNVAPIWTTSHRDEIQPPHADDVATSEFGDQ
jgi:hypothetical protein